MPGLIEAEIEQLADDPPGTPVAKPKRLRAGRQPLPVHLPRIEHRHEPDSCICWQCGQALVKIGDDCWDAGGRAMQEQLPRMSPNNSISSPLNSSCIAIYVLWVHPSSIRLPCLRDRDGGLAAVGLLAWVLISKYADHLPLYRLEQIAARDQVSLSRSTLADWVDRVDMALQPLVDRLTWHLLQGNSLHANETPLA